MWCRNVSQYISSRSTWTCQSIEAVKDRNEEYFTEKYHYHHPIIIYLVEEQVEDIQLQEGTIFIHAK